MSDTPEAYGPRLAAWIDELRDGASVRAFAMARGLDPARVHAWANGATPSMPQLRMLADALDVTIGQVLLAAGLAHEDELEVVVRQSNPAAPDIDDAIERDPNLQEFERAFLRDARAIARQARPGEQDHPPGRKRRTTEVRSHRSNS